MTLIPQVHYLNEEDEALVQRMLTGKGIFNARIQIKDLLNDIVSIKQFQENGCFDEGDEDVIALKEMLLEVMRDYLKSRPVV